MQYPDQLLRLFHLLNEHQLKVVDVGEGLAAVVGNPGSGKTGTIIARLGRLICDGLPSSYVLAMTFTRAAAFEMSERLAKLGIKDARIGTIHSVCRQIIAETTDLLSTARIDEKGVLKWELKKILGDLRRKKKVPWYGVDFEEILRYISACKSEGLCYVACDPFGLNIYGEDYVMRRAHKHSRATGIRPTTLGEIYLEMERRRSYMGLLDYDDMLQWAWLSLLTNIEERNRWRSRFAVAIVDEAQDSSDVQWDISRLLVGLDSCVKSVKDLPESMRPKQDDGAHNLMVCADVSQSIYSWRSAKPDLFLQFWKREDVHKFVLPINYRSNKQICKAASKLVKGYNWHLGGEIVPFNPQDVKDKVRVVNYQTVEKEAAHVVQKCREIGMVEGLRSCAVLARLRVSLDLAEIECIKHRIKYIKMASGSFFESKETEVILGYLRVAGGYDPDGKWLNLIINQPFRFISGAYIRQAEAEAQATGMPLLDVMRGSLADKLTGRQRRALDDLYALLLELHKHIIDSERRADREKAAAASTESEQKEAVKQVDEEGKEEAASTRELNLYGPCYGIALMLRKTRYLEALKREEGLVRYDESKETAIEALRRIAAQFKSYREFLGYVDQIINAVALAKKTGLRVKEGAAGDALLLSTVHRCKGLEFKHVRLIDVTAGTFPSSRAEDLDEELRLFYVAITRAIDTCEVSWAGDDAARSVFVERLQAILRSNEATDSTEAPDKKRARPQPPVFSPSPDAVTGCASTKRNNKKVKLTVLLNGKQSTGPTYYVPDTGAAGVWKDVQPSGDIVAKRLKKQISDAEFKELYRKELEATVNASTVVEIIALGAKNEHHLRLRCRCTSSEQCHLPVLCDYLRQTHPALFE